MRKMNKKGFTIVELVIVIAVIAILAAVLIPTYSSLVKKANRSADIQAVREMNTALAMSEIEGKDIYTAYAALTDAGMTVKDYTPLTSGTEFYWDQELNRVVYVDTEKGTIIYPEVKSEEDDRFILSGKCEVVPVSPETESGETVYKIGTAEELYSLAQELKTETQRNSFTIKFTAQEINLKGLDVGMILHGGSSSVTFKIEGAEGGTTIKNLVSLESHYEKDNKNYFTGLVSRFQTGKLEISNITIENMTVGNLEVGTVGAVVGYVGDGIVDLKNVDVKNTVVYGKNKVGGMIGAIKGASTVTIDSECELVNVTVNCSEGESGKLVGALYSSPSSVTVTALSENVDVSGVSLNLVNGNFTRKQQQTVEYIVVEKLDEYGKSENGWRAFDKEAKYCVSVSYSDATITINTSTTYSYDDANQSDVDGWSITKFKIIK